MKKNKGVVVAGHICLDITPKFSMNKKINLENIFIPGKLVEMEGISIHTGGAVANTGLALKKLGIDVTLIGKVGKDELGSLVINKFAEQSAENDIIVSKDSSTSYSVVIAMPGNDRIFLHNPGANSDFSYNDINFNKIKDASIFHFGYPTLMRNMFLNNGKELKRIFKKVKENGTLISLDMASIDSNSEAGKMDWREILISILPLVDFFVPSVEELCFMLNKKMYNSWLNKAGDKEVTDILKYEDINSLGEEAINMGAKVVLIKCGAPGIYYKTSREKDMKDIYERLNLLPEDWINKEGFEKSYIPEKVVSATGAGDTSIAAFLASTLKRYSLKDALKMATATGACCVTTHDALSGLKSLEDLNKKIENGWEKR